jgi:TPR repeat protein
LKIYHEEADNGDAVAAAFLGQVYEEGVLLPQDMKKAVKYYQKGMNGK